jgi:hypothetical protein
MNITHSRHHRKVRRSSMRPSSGHPAPLPKPGYDVSDARTQLLPLQWSGAVDQQVLSVGDGTCAR